MAMRTEDEEYAEAHDADSVPGEPGKSLFRKNSLDEMTVRRTEKPVAGALPAKPQPISPDDAKPIVRERAGIGSYEDPRDTGRQKKRTGKTGRPGR